MRDIMLIIHFVGLAMGLGTSLAFMFLGIASAKMPKEEGMKFTLNAFALSKMGHIGLTLLVISGLFLMTPFWQALTTSPLLITKLVLVIVLGALIGIITATSKKAIAGDAATHLKKIEPLGKLSLLTAIAIVVLAVYIFH
ncbi:MAG: hypothetical protein DHS20C18_04420 [Saprospiraceae bacterium]|nr:MAG: hypothetical protein DHS20C18_04420 [Saprospiraceae bacterium]